MYVAFSPTAPPNDTAAGCPANDTEPVAAALIVNDCETGAATVKLAFPDWRAMISQFPIASKVTVAPLTEQNAGAGVENETGNPELAFAETKIGDSLNSFAGKAPNAID